uniref:Ricin B lectin domain-containing protein n=1 Tax=Kwoniella dejecticola CBS 10117 TaxID=1296121 RepID=A0A1A6ADU1_9TREE|nr:uncharacterized protein I303_00020 [Kwoniella dejecticola CBS 10117]OBR88209.1 hypothetical protein I303_00020 [Kwoniella dejecticola CBS 10117]
MYLGINGASLSALLALVGVAAHPLSKRYSGIKIQSYRSLRCLSPVGRPSDWKDGTRVTSVPCETAVKWDVSPGSGSILISGTNWALDAGTGDQDNAIIKIWHSYPGLFQQTWYLTDDNRIAITGGSQCLDEGQNGPQTYTCVTGNTNQVWTILGASPTKPGINPSIPSGKVYVDKPNGKGRRIHRQNPKNGSRLTTYGCGSPYTGQSWFWDGTTLALDSRNPSEALGLCLDVEYNSPRTPQKSYDRLKRLQIWKCFPGSHQQIFSVFGDDPSDDC